MDADRFDELTVSLNAGRRALVGGLLAGVTATLFGGGVADAGPVACGAPGDKCKKAADCCDTGCKKKRGKKKGKCKPCGDFRTFCGTVCCPAGASNCDPKLSLCECPDTTEPCGDVCCPLGRCADGACQCPDGRELCPPQCCAAGDTCGVNGCTTATCRAENSPSCVAPDQPLTLCGELLGDCFCFGTPDGGGTCGLAEGTPCPPASECGDDGDCAAGETCVERGGPEGCGCGPAPFGVCSPACPNQI